MQSTLLNIFGTLCLACQLLHVDELKTIFFVMDYNLNIAKFRPKRDEGSEESGKFGLARHYKDHPSKTVSFQDNLQSAVSHLYKTRKLSNPFLTLKKGIP